MAKVLRSDIAARSILTKTSGALRRFAYTLNPYSGCVYACHYCYAAFFARTSELQDEWGNWLHPKVNAPEILAKESQKLRSGDWVYMSSVTDPYVPQEKELELTRRCLEILGRRRDIVVVVQTRGPLVTRDIELFNSMPHIQVNVSITTDDEGVRRAFEPLCPSIERRLGTAKALHDSGVPTCITLSPLLPVHDVREFASRLLSTGVSHFAVDYFEVARGRFVSGTGEAARKVANSFKWDHSSYLQTITELSRYLPELIEGEAGFHYRGIPPTNSQPSLF